MNRFALIMAAAVVFPPGFAVAADAGAAVNLAGDYRMEGKGLGPNDSPYDGTCSLSGDGPAYRVSCYNRETQHTYSRRGLAGPAKVLQLTCGQSRRGHKAG